MMRRCILLSVVLALLGPGHAAAQVRTFDVDYLQIDGKTFQATVYQPEGPGPFPAILDVHGGAWTREDVRRDEHVHLNRALAAMGVVVVAIDYRQSPQSHYPASVIDVNFAMRWLRANVARFSASSRIVGAFASSSGGHLMLLNAMRPSDPRYVALPVAGIPPDGARPDYVILVYPISDPLARRAYAVEVGSEAPVKSTDLYFSPPGSLQEGNPQLILDRREAGALPPALLIQGSADANGVVKDKNVSPQIQQRFVASYRTAGGAIQLELLPGAPHNFVNTAGADLERALALTKTIIGQQLARGGASQSPAPSVAVPEKLKPNANESLVMIVPAKGVQVYECRAKKDQAGEYEWAFVAPEADLFDARGTRIGRHYAGPHWEAADGSKIAGTVKERADAPVRDAIPWLLLTARSVGPDGSFSKVTSIQRVNTAGGVAPKTGCSQATAGTPARVDYTADYYFFAAK